MIYFILKQKNSQFLSLKQKKICKFVENSCLFVPTNILQYFSGAKNFPRTTKSANRSENNQAGTSSMDLNDCLLESENIQITKKDDRYLLQPVKSEANQKNQQQTITSYRLQECGKHFSIKNNFSKFKTSFLIHILFNYISMFTNFLCKRVSLLFDFGEFIHNGKIAFNWCGGGFLQFRFVNGLAFMFHFASYFCIL